MKLNYDKQKVKESLALSAYDERNLAICQCGKHCFPSKLMFIRFLEQFKDVKGEAEIWSERDWDMGTVTIHVEVKYKLPKDIEGSLGSGKEE